ncbi:MAG: hypothetical protein J1F63_02330, partial [Oscillospiraceae bacterium]|nr:hypothetical protein [Oscillospiraceae bacterium]
YAYGVSVDLESDNNKAVATPKIQITLDPKTYFKGNSTNNYINTAYNNYLQWLNLSPGASRYLGVLPHGYYADEEKAIYIAQLPADSEITKEDIAAHIEYNTNPLITAASGDMANVFQNIINDVAGESSSVFVPIEGLNDLNRENAVTYMDPIGKYMEVKTVKKVLLFGELYDVAEDGEEKYYDKDGNETTSDNSSYSSKFYKITTEGLVTNPCYDTSVSFNLADIDIEVRKTGNFSDNTGGGVLSSTNSDQALWITIPATALPMQVATILLDPQGDVESYTTNIGDENTDSPEEYRAKQIQSTPIRVFYEVGIAEDIKTVNGNIDMTKVDPDYITANSNTKAAEGRETGELVYFYSNLYMNNFYNGYADSKSYTYGDPVMSFSPSASNRYYVFEDSRLLFENADNDLVGGEIEVRDNKVYLGAKELSPVTGKVDSDKMYYVMIEYYDHDGIIRHVLPRRGNEFGAGIGAAGDGAYLCWYNPTTNEVQNYIIDNNGNVTRPGNGFYVAAKQGGLRVGDLSAGLGEKTGNRTDTAETYYLPTVSSVTGETSDDFRINLYLGNNGRLAVSNTQLLVTKTVRTTTGAISSGMRNMEFNYTITLNDPNITEGPRDIIKAIRDQSGLWRALIDKIYLNTTNHGLLRLKDSDSPATVGYDANTGTIDPDGTAYCVYIGGVNPEDGFAYTLFDSTNNSFNEALGSETPLNVPDTVYLIPAEECSNNDWVFDDSKKSEYTAIANFRVGYVTFITGAQIGFAVQTDYASTTVYQYETLYFDADGKAHFTLKDGEGLLFNGLDSGTEYVVTEWLTEEQIQSGAQLEEITHVENYPDGSAKNSTYNKNNPTGGAQSLDYDNHTYTVKGETTASLTERVNYFNNTTKTVKEQITPESGYVKVGDLVEYVIYWENDLALLPAGSDTSQITIHDPLDPGADFVRAEFVEQSSEAAGDDLIFTYEPLSPLPAGWSCRYDENTRTAIWNMTVKRDDERQYGYVRLTVRVNEKAPLSFDYDMEAPDAEERDNKIINQARTTINDHTFSTNIVDTPVNEFHKTEFMVVDPDGNETDVGTGLGNLNQDKESGNYVGPLVDKDWLIKYRISYTNYKDVPATVTITDRLDPDVDLDSAEYDKAEYRGVKLLPDSPGNMVEDGDLTITYDPDTRTVKWIISNVEAYGSGDVILTVKVNSAALGEEDSGGGTQTPEPEGPKTFEKYTPSASVLEEGTYVLAYNRTAIGNTISNGYTFSSQSIEINDDTITDLENTTIMWIVEHSDDGSSFYLKNVDNQKYLRFVYDIYPGSSTFVDKASATPWKINPLDPGYFISGNLYFGRAMIYFQGTNSVPMFRLTYYKLVEPETEPEEPDPNEKPEGMGDYKIINRASVTIDSDDE